MVVTNGDDIHCQAYGMHVVAFFLPSEKFHPLSVEARMRQILGSVQQLQQRLLDGGARRHHPTLLVAGDRETRAACSKVLAEDFEAGQRRRLKKSLARLHQAPGRV